MKRVPLFTTVALACSLAFGCCPYDPRRPFDRPNAGSSSGEKNGNAHGPTTPAPRQLRYIMGTLVEIVLYDAGGMPSQDAMEIGFGQLQKVDRLMSNYREQSELSRVNREGAERNVPVSPETFEAIQKGMEWAERTGGAFDPTVYPLVELWKRAEKEQKLPGEAEVRSALERVGYRKVQLDPGARTVRLLVPGVKLDLGGVAKGYGVDLAVGGLKKAGVRCAVVNAGGDLVAFGRTPSGERPLAGIRHPVETDALIGAFPVQDSGVATSGNYERFYEIAGRRYCHIFDPRTGWPVPEVVSTTVVAPNGTDADALATALFVLGPRDGLSLARRLPGTEALVLTLRSNDPRRLRAHATPHFARNVDWYFRLPGL